MHHAGIRTLATSLLVGLIVLSSVQARATVVEFRTVLGDFRVNLFDETTPTTVTNFLDYVNNGNYSDSIFHRSEQGFILQGGGFNFDGTLPLGEVFQNPAVTNEPELSNVRGTIAMAKLGGDPNSATNQWFINLDDNSANLDVQNGGFTAFGIVMDNGMDVVDAIADVERFNFGGALASIPLQNYSAADANAGVDPDATNLIIVTEIVVIDSTVSTGTNLLPPDNTLLNPPPVTLNPGGGGGGGGALSLWMLLPLMLFLRKRQLNA